MTQRIDHVYRNDGDLLLTFGALASVDSIIRRKNAVKTRRATYLIMLCCVDCGFRAAPAKAALLDTWTKRGSQLTDSNLSGIAYGNQTFVAVGSYSGASGAMPLTSTNGVEWNVQDLGSFYDLVSITYGNGIFVSVGQAGAILTSPDGKTWTDRSGATTNRLNGVTWGNGKFIAVGGNTDTPTGQSSSVVLASVDGLSWIAQNTGIQRQLNAVAYGNGTFVAVGNFYSGDPGSGLPLWTSSDGVSWTERNSGSPGPQFGVSYGNGRFVAVSRFGPLITSLDGNTWTNNGTVVDSWAVSYGNGVFVAEVRLGGHEDTTGYAVRTSTDGVTWSEPKLLDGRPTAVGFGAGTFVAVGDVGVILQSQKIGPRLDSAASTRNGDFEFNVLGEVGQRYQVEVSFDLSTWTALTNLVANDSITSFSDSNASLFSKRFYRAVSP